MLHLPLFSKSNVMKLDGKEKKIAQRTKERKQIK
jgi:hypothetical protein